MSITTRQNVAARSRAVPIGLTRTQLALVTLFLAVLFSAIGLVYVTNCSRLLHASLQQSVAEKNYLAMQWDQLLLERGAWIMQARVQHIAEERLGMRLPDNRSTVLIAQW